MSNPHEETLGKMTLDGSLLHREREAIRYALAEIARLREDKARLDWLEDNSRSIGRSTGYGGSSDSWVWRDSTRQLASHDAATLRDAIDAVRGDGAK